MRDATGPPKKELREQLGGLADVASEALGAQTEDWRQPLEEQAERRQTEYRSQPLGAQVEHRQTEYMARALGAPVEQRQTEYMSRALGAQDEEKEVQEEVVLDRLGSQTAGVRLSSATRGRAPALPEEATQEQEERKKQDKNMDELERIRFELSMVACRLSRLRRRRKAEQNKQHEADLHEAWRLRNFHALHQIRGRLAHRGVGPKRRYYWAPPQQIAYDTEWRELLAQSGPDGDMKADFHDFNNGNGDTTSILKRTLLCWPSLT